MRCWGSATGNNGGARSPGRNGRRFSGAGEGPTSGRSLRGRNNTSRRTEVDCDDRGGRRSATPRCAERGPLGCWDERRRGRSRDRRHVGRVGCSDGLRAATGARTSGRDAAVCGGAGGRAAHTRGGGGSRGEGPVVAEDAVAHQQPDEVGISGHAAGSAGEKSVKEAPENPEYAAEEAKAPPQPFAPEALMSAEASVEPAASARKTPAGAAEVEKAVTGPPDSTSLAELAKTPLLAAEAGAATGQMAATPSKAKAKAATTRRGSLGPSAKMVRAAAAAKAAAAGAAAKVAARKAMKGERAKAAMRKPKAAAKGAARGSGAAASTSAKK